MSGTPEPAARSRSRSRSGEKAGSRSGSDDEEEAYEVEEIRDKRRGDDGDYLYYVKWKNWGSDTNTWEPVEHFDDCKEKLTDFERKWRKRQERKEERRKEEKQKIREERRQRELKAAARFSLKQDSDDERSAMRDDYSRSSGGAGSSLLNRPKPKRVAESSDSEDGGNEADKERREKREKERQERREKERKQGGPRTNMDRLMDRKDKDRGDKKGKDDKKPKYIRDVKPVKILGLTTDPGELCFYVQFESGLEPGLVTAKEAYQKIPDMCFQYYESRLVWRARPPQKEPESELANGVGKVKLSPEAEAAKEAEPATNGGPGEGEGSNPPAAATAASPPVHSYS